MSYRTELMASLGVLAVLGVVSFGHLLWGGTPAARLWHDKLYTVLGGRIEAQQPGPARENVTAALQSENQRLHQLLGLKARLPGFTQAARVVRREPDTWWEALELEFAQPTQPLPQGVALVLSSQGLIGTLDTADLTHKDEVYRGRAILLSSSRTQLSVIVGEREAPFLLQGRGGAELALRPVTSGAEKGVSMGDSVLTSGLGQLYSRGLLIGHVGREPGVAIFSACASSPPEVVLWWR
jgi:hypothetical protein